MAYYPDDFDFAMSETFRRGLAWMDGQTIPDGEAWQPKPTALLREIEDLKRANRMLNDQLRAMRERGQAWAQPPQQPRPKRKGGVEL